MIKICSLFFNKLMLSSSFSWSWECSIAACLTFLSIYSINYFINYAAFLNLDHY